MKINIFLIFQSEVKKNLEWFQNAFNAQSSFTTGALMEAKEANRKGYYDIGYINETKENYLTKTATLESAVIFHTTGSEKKSTLSNIEELQSRLMLLGHAQESGAESVNREKQYFLKVNKIIVFCMLDQ